ncbi:replication initiation negative regulator SeqA [Shewanella sp. D64]|uniref:replication initiation negative regulator SeqA n=1 Tax=unclassified Shewanella TaxID=196818 RepID=UPI0022BA5809|nr:MULTISPECIES: replication initiation negative regulator SeqA [unclassified Shewanella]MEC4724127.1 replication initiation negative regulator SeqA [Shewanella sp. D64]MEC4736147.1 replication initiation negative regulator SeqA [Shewanella sp. E94]WBJ97912.1 replication initiation negative regulator SeqA [Shewanella sp. MTB7]
MKYIEVDEELYRLIASKTERIGESASEILRRLLGLEVKLVAPLVKDEPEVISQPSFEKVAAEIVEQPRLIDLDACIDKEELAVAKGAVGRFLFILQAVYLASPQKFEQVLKIKGRDRLYFATSKQSLLKSSKSANPKEIGQSGYWVTTNNSTAKKRTILTEVLQQYGTVEGQIEAITTNL